MTHTFRALVATALLALGMTSAMAQGHEATIRKALSDQWQIDASASRQGGQSIWTLGTKFSF